MASIASYPARRLKRRRNEWLRRNATVVALVLAGFVVIGVISSLILLIVPMPGRLYSLGLVHAALIAAGLHLLNSAFLAHDQEAVWQLRGAWGEDNTRSELQRAKRKRLIWDWIDSFELQAGDIDHLVITRHGGVLAIDSKWRNHVTAEDVPAMARSSRRAALRAEGLLRSVLKRESGARHRTTAKPVTVTPVVVLWGAARTGVPSDAIIDGVRFLDGRQLLQWLGDLDGHEVPRDAARGVMKLLKDYRSKVTSAMR
ncbi:NERD domain-containing protein [Nocardioides sp. KIGAM211]|uniref:NERD domain-containing protein n=1 Tax=Nocardioides luti TaxID=2761101 RepID=A0A7X0RGK7_9ACTN|nr:nuclease-related domain-containing protein [Nocardioides luti]MBB6627924.1 NERD domain-containing protein [Nocardioides luti]